MSDNLIDLDLYREERVKDGSWPPTELDDVVGYWRSRRAPKKPTYDTIEGPKDGPPEKPEPPRYGRRVEDQPKCSSIPTIQPPFPAWMMDIIRGDPYQTPPV